MALVDNRIINRQDALLGAIQGNLAYGKFMFTVYPKFALHRDSKDFDKTLSFIHQCERTDLMEPEELFKDLIRKVECLSTNENLEIKELVSLITLDNEECEQKFSEDKILNERYVSGNKERIFVLNNEEPRNFPIKKEEPETEESSSDMQNVSKTESKQCFC
ncbi:uncharacterized protein LOC118482624 [Helianthus annuus]|uniref:uncharacterized protein LOC118482624 n=1 Tax=Helianthus annuus TaxID=4232 RepID=UPI0016530053|nr:uncharacterized protein LOC118482624 [Helianthus annuus]